MKRLFLLGICLIICYIHLTSSEPSTTKKPVKQSTKAKEKKSTANGHTSNAKAKEKNTANDRTSNAKAKKTPNIRTPFDQVLEKLSNCAATSTLSPSVAEVMEENLVELQGDEKYISLFNAAPHMAAFLKKKKKDPTKFITGLRQSLHADWSNPAWKSYKEIDTLFRPLKQQFVYTMMRFNCT